MNEIKKILEGMKNLRELKEFLIEEIPDESDRSEPVSIIDHAIWNRDNPIVPAVRIRTSDVKRGIRSVLPRVFQTDTQEVALSKFFLYISVKAAIRKVLTGGNA